METTIRSRPTTRLALLLVVVAMLATLAPATPANALQYDCPNGKFCAWKDSGFTGQRIQTTVDVNALDPYGFNDNISSAFNRNSATFSLHQHVDCAGIKQTFASGVAVSQVNRNDDASSINDWAQVACVSN